MSEKIPPPSVITPGSVAVVVDPDYTSAHDDIGLLDLLQILADNLRLLVLGPLAAGLIALVYSFTITPTFTAATKFMSPQQQQSGAVAMLAGLGALGGLAGAAGIKNPADQYVGLLKSRSVQDALMERFNLLERYKTQFRLDAMQTLDNNVQITSGKDGLITVEVNDTDPVIAAKLADAHVEELGKLLNRLAVTDAQQRRLFFEKQLAQAKDNLVRSERALKASGMNINALKIDPKAAIEGLAKLKATIAAQEIRLGAMRGYLTESAPEFRQAVTELSAMRIQLTNAEKTESGTNAKGEESDYIGKYRDFKYSETLFEIFAKQFEIARVDESREGAVIQVVDKALVPERNSNPKRVRIALQAYLASSFVLLVFVFISRGLRSASKAPGSAEKISRLRRTLAKAFGRGQ